MARISTRSIAAVVAVGAVAFVVGGLLPAGAASRAPATYKGVVGGTFQSFSGNPAAVNSSGVPTPKVGDVSGVALSLPKPAKQGLSEAVLGVLGGTNEKGECAGSYAHPSAPAGYLCVYPDLDNSINVYQGKNLAGVVVSSDGVAYVTVAPIGDGRFGVELDWNAATPGPSTLNATYAYTPAN